MRIKSGDAMVLGLVVTFAAVVAVVGLVIWMIVRYV